MYPQHGVGPGMVYASPTPNGGMIFSLGGEAAGRGQFIIPLPLGLPAQQAAADLSKAKKWHIFLIYSRFFPYVFLWTIIPVFNKFGNNFWTVKKKLITEKIFNQSWEQFECFN